MGIAKTMPTPDFRADIEIVAQIEAVPTILDVICHITGMGFAAVARVTEDRWIACGVLDTIAFGLKPGGELKVETTICNEIRQSGQPVVIDHVAEDTVYCGHQTAVMYGFQSYISMPIVLSDGSFFGTLCAIDPRPARINNPETIGMFRLFAELISKHLDAHRKHAAVENELRREREFAELREQFIAVLGHDLRTPVKAFSWFTDLLMKTPLTEEAAHMTRLMRDSASRMRSMIDNLTDLARSRQGSGLTLNRDAEERLEPVLGEVIAELKAGRADRAVETNFAMAEPINCDRTRIAQLFSNLLGNAFSYGRADRPIRVRGVCADGHFELSVTNFGEQIPPSALEHLFQPFYRRNTFQAREGLGLGLYIAHQIALAHGGTLEVDSTTVETCFTFRMPLA